VDEEDFRALIRVVQANFVEIGAPELADVANYVVQEGEAEENRLPPPAELLLEMLRAFERHMAVRDRATYRDAMARIGRSVEGVGPERAVVVPLAGDVNELEVDLSRAPELSPLRADVRRLSEALEAAGSGPPRAEA
jgi:hypothetical protein